MDVLQKVIYENIPQYGVDPSGKKVCIFSDDYPATTTGSVV